MDDHCITKCKDINGYRGQCSALLHDSLLCGVSTWHSLVLYMNLLWGGSGRLDFLFSRIYFDLINCLLNICFDLIFMKIVFFSPFLLYFSVVLYSNESCLVSRILNDCIYIYWYIYAKINIVAANFKPIYCIIWAIPAPSPFIEFSSKGYTFWTSDSVKYLLLDLTNFIATLSEQVILKSSYNCSLICMHFDCMLFLFITSPLDINSMQTTLILNFKWLLGWLLGSSCLFCFVLFSKGQWFVYHGLRMLSFS